MPPLRFIHAADLHLDAVFPGLARDISPGLAQRLHEATFTALRRLVELCREWSPDFLVLAGDVWNGEDLSLRAQRAMLEACEELGRMGVRVFMAHGNHDPLSSRLKSLHWPDNVTVFGPALTAVPVQRPGYGDELCAVVHGVSHVGPKETRNMASWFRRTQDSCPQIGVLHTTLNTGGGEAYAPCSPDDLVAAGLDYWALGHIHEYGSPLRTPPAVYAGSLQGLNINEQGPHGCVLVTVEGEPGDSDSPLYTASMEFRPLAPVGWRIVDVDMESLFAGMDTPAPSGAEEESTQMQDEADLTRLARALRDTLDDAAAQVWQGCQSLVIRLRLHGRTPLDGALRRMPVREALCEMLREDMGEPGADEAVALYLKDLLVETRPLLDREAALGRGDLLSEVLRKADEWRAADLETRVHEALGDLFLHRRHGRVLNEPEGEQMTHLLDEAERLCADMLERTGP